MPCNDTIEEYVLPQIEALLAGTLALMTALAQANAQCTHRELMAAKVRDNLTQLAMHPQLSGTLRTVLSRAVYAAFLRTRELGAEAQQKLQRTKS